MEAWTSRIEGTDYDAILDGFSNHRNFDLARRASQPLPSGEEIRSLRNRANFTAFKGKEVNAQIKTAFTDHKVWSA